MATLMVPLLAVLAFPWPGDLRPTTGVSGHDRAVRQAEADALARRSDPRAGAALRRVLDDLDPGVRLTAARALARRGDPAAFETAVKWLRGGTLQDRAAALDVVRLAGRLSPEARRAVERTLADPDSAVKLMALEVLAAGDVSGSVPAIASALDDSASQVRLAAVRLLGASRDPRAMLPLVLRLEDIDRTVRREAIVALGELGDVRAGGAIERLIGSATEELRRAAIDAAARLRLAGAVPALAAHASRRPADEVARRAQWALGRIGSPEGTAILAKLLRHPPVTAETRDALVAAGPTSVPLLIEELSASGGAAATAAALLGTLRDPRAVPALRAVVHRRGEAVGAAMRALGEIGSPEAVVLLATLTSDAEIEVRRMALGALATAGDDRARGLVGAALADGDPHVRAAGLALAGALGAAEHSPALLSRLADPDAEVRRAAVNAAATLALPEASAAALRALPRLGHVRAGLLGELFERTAGPRDVEPLARGARGAGPLRGALLRGAAAGARRGEGGRGGEAGLAELGSALARRDNIAAELAAELMAEDGDRDRQRALRAFYESAPPSVGARLAEAIADEAEGERALVRTLEDGRKDESLRAAAAWALRRGGDEARAALARAASTLHPAIAANASAALADRGSRSTRGATLRPLTAEGRPLPGTWVRAALADGRAVWARTGAGGGAWLRGLPAEGASLSIVDAELVLDRPGNSVGEIARDERPEAE